MRMAASWFRPSRVTEYKVARGVARRKASSPRSFDSTMRTDLRGAIEQKEEAKQKSQELDLDFRSPIQGFSDARHGTSFAARRMPASEKRQGTKSRAG